MEIFNYDNRSLRLLNILESNFLVQDQYLLDVLKVSSKTISNEIKSLNELFEDCAYIENKNSNYNLYISKFTILGLTGSFSIVKLYIVLTLSSTLEFFEQNDEKSCSPIKYCKAS